MSGSWRPRLLLLGNGPSHSCNFSRALRHVVGKKKSRTHPLGRASIRYRRWHPWNPAVRTILYYWRRERTLGASARGPYTLLLRQIWFKSAQWLYIPSIGRRCGAAGRLRRVKRICRIKIVTAYMQASSEVDKCNNSAEKQSILSFAQRQRSCDQESDSAMATSYTF